MTRRRLALSALLWLMTTICVHAQSAEPARRAQIDDLMSRYAGEVPGSSLLVVRDGKAIVRRGYGYGNLEKHVEAGPETNYRLASVTKQFTAACILLLKQDGRLRLEDRVRKWQSQPISALSPGSRDWGVVPASVIPGLPRQRR